MIMMVMIILITLIMMIIRINDRDDGDNEKDENNDFSALWTDAASVSAAAGDSFRFVKSCSSSLSSLSLSI